MVSENVPSLSPTIENLLVLPNKEPLRKFDLNESLAEKITALLELYLLLFLYIYIYISSKGEEQTQQVCRFCV